jgi:hypothetical protein
MKLPRTLYVGYNLLKKSRVSVKKENDEEALSYFQNILNEAQPKTPEDLILHRFVKGMYNENKNRFLSFIKNTSFECLVLWTESRSIVNYLGLRGVVYTKWTGKETLYSVTQFQSTNRDDNVADSTSYEHPIVRLRLKQKDPEILITVLKGKVPVSTPEHSDEVTTPTSKNTSEPVTYEKEPDSFNATRKTGGISAGDEFLSPGVLSLTRLSSFAVGTGAPLMWGDMDKDDNLD